MAVPDDAAAIATLEREALGADAWSEGLVAEGVAGRIPTTIYLVADTAADTADTAAGPSEGSVLGYAAASIVADVAELQRIAVDAGQRRRGLATDLLAEVVRQAGLRHADRVLLEVREDNEPALHFYAARGFAELDRRPRYYADGTTAIVLAKEVAP